MQSMAGPDYILDLEGHHNRQASSGTWPSKAKGQSWLAINWKCCSVYSRIYRNRQQTAYEGRCPKCARPLHVPIGPGGTDQRFFDAF